MARDMQVGFFEVDPLAALDSFGRNGFAKTHGVEIQYPDYRGAVSLTPFTSKGSAQSCIITITPEAMDQLAQWWLNLRSQVAE